ncbi:hypothetical protein B0I35DRAFT_8272 [Stachybotrys elegans]|uniref:Steroid 5-alpha reductase C-terminal domain-containing protein n=1 Tax=Stachybotrys elegans TaxID=80388 RepID=A0A8K0T649_9HYPO|nr:hypothetical protein B0I35DRAFT_8272 [Stachybotrys elegans]
MADKTEKADLINRGDYSPSPGGTITFLGLRPLGPLLQYHLLSGVGTTLLAKAGFRIIASPVTETGIAVIDRLNMPLPHLIVLAMSTGAAVKQIYWLVGLSRERFGVGAGIAVTMYNTLLDSVNTLLFLSAACSATNGPAFPGAPSLSAYQVVGSALYVVGILLETISESQRKAFKDKPANKGKVMRSGLWSLARHINYGGYVIWRSAYALAAWGVAGGLFVATFQGVDFAVRGVPMLDKYCQERYGEQWAGFRRQVKWLLVPGIY